MIGDVIGMKCKTAYWAIFPHELLPGVEQFLPESSLRVLDHARGLLGYFSNMTVQDCVNNMSFVTPRVFKYKVLNIVSLSL
jgi:hypothetical protein